MNPAALACLVAAVLGGSGPITVGPSKGDGLLSAWHKSMAAPDKPSERTHETLKRYDLATAYRRDPDAALLRLEQAARRAPEPELVYALAELSWVAGRRAEGRRRGGGEALEHYVDTVAYAFDFLFDPELAEGRSPSDPRFRLACDLYNGALDRLIRAARSDKKFLPGDAIELKIRGGKQTLRVALSEPSPWKATDIHELHLAADYEVTGLDSRSRLYGLGVPLIGVRKSNPSPEGPAADKFFPPETAFPLTAVLRPNRRLRDEARPDEVRECTLDLVDPVRYRTIGSVALEADVTTPLAYMWSRTDLSRYRWTGLFRPGEAMGRSQLMFLRPYEADKIPVVMVHGLASSPLAWIPMLNELLRDPRIQSHYQFLLYVYPTGVPIPIAAAGLRDALRDAQAQFDPQGRDPRVYLDPVEKDRPFRRTVLLGHSMGGLLSHAMVVHSDNKLWELSSYRRLDELLGPPELLAEVKRYSFFEPLPFVKRVVFLATPHRGSEYSRRMVGRVISNQINEPDYYTKLLARLIKDNPDAFDRRKFRRLPTSIETLDTDSPVLKALLAMRPAPDVRFDSIIGTNRPGGVAGTTDGVVPYASAHLEGVPERVVQSDHAVQKDPEAILEVRRILLEHLGGGLAARPPAAR